MQSWTKHTLPQRVVVVTEVGPHSTFPAVWFMVHRPRGNWGRKQQLILNGLGSSVTRFSHRWLKMSQEIVATIPTRTNHRSRKSMERVNRCGIHFTPCLSHFAVSLIFLLELSNYILLSLFFTWSHGPHLHWPLTSCPFPHNDHIRSNLLHLPDSSHNCLMSHDTLSLPFLSSLSRAHIVCFPSTLLDQALSLPAFGCDSKVDFMFFLPFPSSTLMYYSH